MGLGVHVAPRGGLLGGGGNVGLEHVGWLVAAVAGLLWLLLMLLLISEGLRGKLLVKKLLQ